MSTIISQRVSRIFTNYGTLSQTVCLGYSKRNTLKERDAFNQRQSPVGNRVHPRDPSSASSRRLLFPIQDRHPVQLTGQKLRNCQMHRISFRASFKLAREKLSRRSFRALSRYKCRGKGETTTRERKRER